MMCVFKKPVLVTRTRKEKKRGKMETWCEIARKNKGLAERLWLTSVHNEGEMDV